MIMLETVPMPGMQVPAEGLRGHRLGERKPAGSVRSESGEEAPSVLSLSTKKVELGAGCLRAESPGDSSLPEVLGQEKLLLLLLLLLLRRLSLLLLTFRENYVRGL